MNATRLFKMPFSTVYPLYVKKVERKGHTKEEVDEILYWMTGYDEATLKVQLAGKVDLSDFFDQAPALNPNVSKITGVVCGIRVEEIEDPLMRKIRYMDKLIDELANGKSMVKILRQ